MLVSWWFDGGFMVSLDGFMVDFFAANGMANNYTLKLTIANND